MLLYTKERTIAMNMITHSLFWAAALLGIALLAVFDIVPEELAQYSVIALPVLATLGFIKPGACKKVRA